MAGRPYRSVYDKNKQRQVHIYGDGRKVYLPKGGNRGTGASPTDPTASMTMPQIQTLAGQLADLDTGGDIAALQNERSQAINQGKFFSGLSDQYSARVNQLLQPVPGQIASIGANMQQVLAQNAQRAQATQAQLMKEFADRQAADEAVRPGSGQSSANAALTQMGMSTADNARIAGNYSAQAAAAQQKLATELQAAAQLGAQQQRGMYQLAVQKQLGDVNSKLAQVQGQRGSLVAKYLMQLRKDEADRQIAIAGLGLQGRQIDASLANNLLDSQTSIANNNADNAQSDINSRRNASTAARRDATARRGQDLAHQDRVLSVQARLASQSGKTGGLTPKQRADLRRANNEVRGGILAAVANWDTIANAKVQLPDGSTRKPTEPEIENALAKNTAYHLDAQLAKVVANMRHHGGRLTQEGVRILQARGITVPRAWLPTGAAGYGKGGSRPD